MPTRAESRKQLRRENARADLATLTALLELLGISPRSAAAIDQTRAQTDLTRASTDRIRAGEARAAALAPFQERSAALGADAQSLANTLATLGIDLQQQTLPTQVAQSEANLAQTQESTLGAQAAREQRATMFPIEQALGVLQQAFLAQRIQSEAFLNAGQAQALQNQQAFRQAQ